MDTERQEPEGYEIPLYVALTKPVLLAGVPRELGILTIVTALVLTLGLHQWITGALGGLLIHAIAAALTQRDAQWMDLLRRHLSAPRYLEG